MKLFTPLVASTLVLAGCAGMTDESVKVAEAIAAGDSCRQVTFGSGAPETACGTAEQWAEFDRRAAFINAGVTCRGPAPHQAEACMTEEQWEEHDRRVRILAGAQRVPDEQASNAAQIGFAMDRATAFQAEFDASQAAMQGQ